MTMMQPQEYQTPVDVLSECAALGIHLLVNAKDGSIQASKSKVDAAGTVIEIEIPDRLRAAIKAHSGWISWLVLLADQQQQEAETIIETPPASEPDAGPAAA